MLIRNEIQLSSKIIVGMAAITFHMRGNLVGKLLKQLHINALITHITSNATEIKKQMTNIFFMSLI
jgi:hypothetical protein